MSDTKPDLDAIEARGKDATGKRWQVTGSRYIVSGNQTVAQAVWALADAEFIAHAREDVPALVAYARTLEAEVEEAEANEGVAVAEAEAAEVERDLLRDTLALRSAAHDRLAQRLDQVRALADDWDADWREDLNVVELHAELRRVLDGDYRAAHQETNQ